MVFVHNTIPFDNIDTEMVRNQRWYLTPAGKMPSITTVLSAKEKPQIEAWKARLGRAAADKETKRAADRGSALHDMCEKYVNNDPAPTVGHDQPNIALFNKMRHALKHITCVYAQEVALYSEHLGVAGRTDVVGEYKGVPSIIDYKSSTSNKTTSMIEDYFIQEAFYGIAFFERTGIEIPQIVTIMACERAMMPKIWVRPIKPYIKPLLTRIADFRRLVAA